MWDGPCASSRRRTAPCSRCSSRCSTSTKSWNAAAPCHRISTCRRERPGSLVDGDLTGRADDAIELVRPAFPFRGLLVEDFCVILELVCLHACLRGLVPQLRSLRPISQLVLGGACRGGSGGHGPPRRGRGPGGGAG